MRTAWSTRLASKTATFTTQTIKIQFSSALLCLRSFRNSEIQFVLTVVLVVGVVVDVVGVVDEDGV